MLAWLRQDADVSIRRRALDLVLALVNEDNIQALTTELLDYLKVSRMVLCCAGWPPLLQPIVYPRSLMRGPAGRQMYNLVEQSCWDTAFCVAHPKHSAIAQAVNLPPIAMHRSAMWSSSQT